MCGAATADKDVMVLRTFSKLYGNVQQQYRHNHRSNQTIQRLANFLYQPG
jgi:hypothetical protein